MTCMVGFVVVVVCLTFADLCCCWSSLLLAVVICRLLRVCLPLFVVARCLFIVVVVLLLFDVGVLFCSFCCVLCVVWLSVAW